MKGDKFQCALCHHTFIKQCTEEEAKAQYKKEFPDHQDEECVHVCDDCYHLIMASRR